MPRVPCLPDFRRTHPLTRRALLRVGAVGLTGLTLPNVLRAEKAGTPRKATAKSVIMLFQFGGPSHLDTFDPKPDAPAEIRGEFKAIQTKTPGLLVTEHLPKLAERSDLYAVVRSVRHTQVGPQLRGVLLAHRPRTARRHRHRERRGHRLPAPRLDRRLPRPRPTKTVPSFVALPTMIADGPFRTPGEFAGLLGKAHDPLWVLNDPNAADFKVTSCRRRPGWTWTGIDDRKAIQAGLAGLSDLADRTAEVRGDAATTRPRALDLLTSATTQKAFAIQDEPREVRDRYGRHTYGQSVLLARRLVEAGVRFVTVYYSRRHRRLGHAQGQLHHAQGQPPAAHRPHALRPARRPGGPRAARRDAGVLDGRLRPDAEDQQGRRPRPLAAVPCRS